jgi:lactate racemase
MPRPGAVVEVDERTPPLLVHHGEQLRFERFPLGTRAIYAPDVLPGLPDPDAAIAHALEHPHGRPPLRELLKPGMRLTIAFDDISLPLPPMRAPDIRQRVIEQVLTLAARAGVDDVELIAANAVHRRMTADEIRHIVGDRVFRSFWPDHLVNHDAEDVAGMKHIGVTEHGEDVEINRRAAESDLLVYVNVNLVTMDGGHKSVPVGLASYRSLRPHHNVKTMLHSTSYMDPKHSAMHGSATRMGRLLAKDLTIFTVETTINNAAFPEQLGFFTKREWEWSVKDQATAFGLKRALDRMPAKARRKAMHASRAAYRMTSVQAGETEAVHEHTLASVHRQQLVEVEGQTDVLVTGVPYVGPYNVNSIMNPILATCMGLGYWFNMYKGRPLVREGGVMILFHPLAREFNAVHHPSYIDFFDQVLADTTNPALIEEKYEESYATDPWYIHLYRSSHAYHGVHPFYMWYWAAHGMDHLGDVIWVGANPGVARRMGFRAASTLTDALEMASDTVGRDPSISYLHAPPLTLAEVR